MRLNTNIEEEYGKGEHGNHRSSPGTHTFALASATAGGADDGASRGPVLRINHAHEEQMGMGDHPIN
jgi:hypothetical protein